LWPNTFRYFLSLFRSHSIAFEALWPKSQFRIYVTRSTGTWKRHKQASTHPAFTPRSSDFLHTSAIGGQRTLGARCSVLGIWSCPGPIRGQVDCGYALVLQLTSNRARRCGESSVNGQPRFGQVSSDSGQCFQIPDLKSMRLGEGRKRTTHPHRCQSVSVESRQIPYKFWHHIVTASDCFAVI